MRTVGIFRTVCMLVSAGSIALAAPAWAQSAPAAPKAPKAPSAPVVAPAGPVSSVGGAPPPAGPVAPAPNADRVAQARSHFARAVKLYQEEDFRAALIEFSRAYELAPHWAVLYNIGQASYQLRDYVGALNSLERYVREGDEKVPPERRAEVGKEIEELRGRVAHVTVSSNVEADIALDDAPLGKTSSSEPWLVGAGRHKVTVSKPGYVSSTQTLDVAGGDTLAVRFDLATQPSEPPRLPVAPTVPVVPQDSANYTWPAVSATVGVAGIVVGATFGVLTINTKNTLDAECHASKSCPASAQGDIDAYARNGTISGIGFGVGAAGLLLGTYLFFHENGKGARPSSQLGLAPWVGPNGAGVMGAF
jgi:hypothetical protein